MAENLGAIRYDVEVGTAGMLKAESVVSKSTTNVANSFNKADASVKALNTQVSHTAKAVRRARPDMQNMSYQLQDMAVQAQMGTSAFVIMAQQLPQMLVGMGAWAGAIGVAITVLGLMATTLIDTTTDLEKMEKAVEQVKAVITIGAGGVANYSDELKKLSTISKEITQIKLNTALAQQQKALRMVGSAAKEAYEAATPFFNLNWDNYKNQQEAVFDNIIDDKELEKLGRTHPLIDNAMNGVYGLNDALLSIKNGNTDAGIERITSALDLLSRSAAVNTKEGESLILTMTNLVEQYKIGKLTVEQLQAAMGDSAEGLKGNASALQSFLDEMYISNTLLKEGERAALKLRLEKDNLTDSEIKIALAAYDYNQRLIEQKEQTEENVKADKKRKKSLEDVNDALDAFFDKEQRDDRKKSEREAQTNITFAQGIINKGKSPEEQMAEQYARLKQLRDTDLENAQLYQEAMTALELQAQQNREDLLGESYKRIGQQAADSMGDYLSGVSTAEEATRALASTIISQAIQSLVQMGTQAVIQSMTTTTAATTGIAATTGAAVTSTGVMAGAQSTAMATVAGAVGTIAGGLATAWAPAAAFASLATLGTNAAPAIAGIYSTMAATLGAQLVGGIASNAITAATGFNGTSGGRQYGGPVSQGMYRVNETGTPEIYSQGGKDYLMNTKNANITPLDKAGGGSQMPQIIVNNNSPEKAYVTYDEVTRIAKVQIGKEANLASQGRGVMLKGLSSGTNVRNKANRG